MTTPAAASPGSPTGAPSGPTVRRLIVGSQLRRLREAAGITRAEAGYHIRGSESKISRLELGRVSFKDRDIRDLLMMYGLAKDDPGVETLVQLAEEANQPGWWHNYDDVTAKWFETYIGLEEAADQVRSYEIQFVPGLLQTEDYARGIVTTGMPGATTAEIERRVQVKMERQGILDRETPPTIWAVVDESALRRPIGGPKVHRAQLEHLLLMTERPNITLQVMPFNRGGHPAQGGAFTILRFDDKDLADIVYLEQLNSALYLDKLEQVDGFLSTFSLLATDSLPPTQSIEMLRRILDRL